MILLDQKQTFLEKLVQERADSSSLVFGRKAFDHFLEIGLPDKKSLGYEYFPLSKLYEEKSISQSMELTKDKILEKVLPECLESYIVICNGKVNLELSNISRISSGIILEKLENNSSPYMPFVHSKLVQMQKKELDPFALFCQSSLKGLLAIVKEGLILEAPLQIITCFDTQQCLPSVNLYVHVGKNASCELIHTNVHFGFGQTTSFVDIDLDQGARCTVIRFNQASSSIMLDTMRVHLKKEAKVNIFDLHMPDVPSKFHLHVLHHQELSESNFHALSLIEEKKDYYISTHFEHIAHEARSSQHIKTVLSSKAKASFEGQIHVHKEALLTQSYQRHATLMLGEHGSINSKPNLRIFADDVKASHGATIAELDQDSLFYLKTRGLDEKTAKRLLLDGFCLDIIQNLNLDSLKEEALCLLERIDDL